MALLLRDRRFVLALVPATLVVALVTGLPTVLVENPWFTRMTPVRPLDVVLWVVLSPLAGALIATYAVDRARSGTAAVHGAGTGLASTFAIGCPVCNKLVVMLLGTSGALTWFAPVQPVLGLAAVAFAVWALRVRVRQLSGACASPPVPAPA